MYQAFLDYRRKYDKNISVPFKAEPEEEVSIPTVVPQKETKEEKVVNLADNTSESGKLADPANPETPEISEVQVNLTNPNTQNPPNEPVAEQQTANTELPVAPVFKVQVMTGDLPLKANDKRLRGLSDVGFYQEGAIYKYTVGASENYNEIYKLRKSLIKRFPQAFIIAFKDGQKMDVREAIKEFKRKGITKKK